MATNPRFPEQRPKDDLNARLRQNQPKSGAPWVLVALLVAAALLIAVVAFLPRAPKASPTPTGAEIPAQPTGQQIQFTNVRLMPSPVGNTVALDAVMTNAGNTDVTGVAVDAKFIGKDGTVLAAQRGKVMGIEGNTAGDTQDLTQAPVKPNQQRPVRIVFDNVPADWNHEPPALTVAMVTGAGSPAEVNGVSPNVKGATVKPGESPSAPTAQPVPKQ